MLYSLPSSLFVKYPSYNSHLAIEEWIEPLARRNKAVSQVSVGIGFVASAEVEPQQGAMYKSIKR